MMEGSNDYALDAFSSFAAASFRRCRGSVERCEVTRTSVLNTETLDEVSFDCKGEAWADGEIVRWRGFLKEQLQRIAPVVYLQ